MAIWLVTGATGTGKTHFVMKKMQEEIKKGRKVYTNIAECKLQGVEPIPVNDKNELDWTLTPQGNGETDEKGALIVYDETQKLDYFAYKRGEKLSDNKLLKDLETHRHLGYELIFITQSPKFLHLHLLELVNEHYHVNRRFNKQQSEICLYRNKYEPNPMTKAAYDRAEDIFTVNYDKKLFEQYKSTEIVTNKGFRISRKLRNGLIIVGLIFSALFYYIFFKDNQYLKTATGQNNTQQNESKTTTQDSTQATQAQETGNNQDHTQNINIEQMKQQIELELRQKYLTAYTVEVMNDEMIQPASIISYENTCRAYNKYGDVLNISQKACKNLLANPHLIPKNKNQHYQQSEIKPSIENNVYKKDDVQQLQQQTLNTQSNMIEAGNNNAYFEKDEQKLTALTSEQAIF